MGRLGSGAIALGITAVLTGEAQALSCLEPQIETSFNHWVDAPAKYYIGVGTLTALGPLPEVPSPGKLTKNPIRKPDLTTPYRFQGYLLGGDEGPLDLTITVVVGCLGPWCGRFPSNGTYGLMPLQITEQEDYKLRISPCPGTIFPAGVESKVRQCMAAGRCAEPPRQ